MRVLLTSEARFERAPDGVVWAQAAYGGALWSRYLDVFSTVLIVARVADVQDVSSGSVVASLPGVQFCPLPAYSGLSGLLRASGPLCGSVQAAVRRAPALIVRAPSPIAYLTGRVAARAKRPFGVEIVGDPNQVFASGAFRHPLRPAIRCLATAAQRRLSRNAVAVLYVTRQALQRQYPTWGRFYAASDVALDDVAFAGEEPRQWRRTGPFVIVTVGALDQPYKGTAVLLDAVAELRRRGAPVKLRIVGGGRLISELQQYSALRGTSADVEFLGQQDRAGVREALDSAHLFVLPSLTEGLPRALLEAMARCLPAVATDVGGVPELLPPECLVPPRNALALADCVERLMVDDAGRYRLAKRNLSHARHHHERVQTAVRREFLQFVRAASAGSPWGARCA